MSMIDGLRRWVSTFVAARRLGWLGAELGQDIVFHGQPILSLAPSSRVKIGDRAVLTSRSQLTALGVRAPIILRTLTHGASIDIGPDCGLSGTAICAALSVSIGARCLIGADCMIFDTDFHNLDPNNRRYTLPKWDQISAAVIIGEDVFLGTRSIITKGVTIGRGSIVAAGSLVCRDVPEYTIVGGNPARELRTLDSASELV